MRNTLKRIDGVYYANGVAYKTLHDALKAIWNQ